ncbi:MAG: DUF3015 domain-containing protein [bacterium]
MKKLGIGIALCLIMIMVSSVYGEQPRGNCGCGLGTMAFEGKNGLLFQVLAATTNGSFGNQTFGITSGTLECEQAPSFTSNEPLNRFVKDNMDDLAKDIAQGRGESLDTLAELMGIPAEERPLFYARLQTSFSEIFPSGTITHVDVLENIAKVMQG